MGKGLPVAWFKNVDPEKRANYEETLRNSSTALSRLYDIVEEKEQTMNSQEVSLSDFDNPSWPYKQAYRNGQKAALKEMKELLAFIKG